MTEQILKTEIHDMSKKIYELQNKTEHLTNGQRYAVVSEIEKNTQLLRNDLRLTIKSLNQISNYLKNKSVN